ncbi:MULTISPECIES: tetratricopeptide repeat-containing sulfotransferase family protein [Microbulbifer]|uniref:tetratricopeptide repeat-containing sulfotransferase family protein n=1 Tax=Microbulbifer TaxID=48073 RepID=UPI001F2C699C|nr:tetratricopeptide repeat-containing sulfotransferase family protein [Microbulbifer zhoushanensis]
MNQPDPFTIASQAVHNGEPSRACKILESGINHGQVPAERMVQARQMLAELYIEQRQFGAARQQLQALDKLVPGHLPGRILAAHIARLEGHASEANRLLTSLATAAEASQAQLRFIAAEFVALGAYQQVIQTLQRVEPMDAQSFYHLGLSHFRLGNIGKALPIYRRLFASIPDNPAIARELSLVAAAFREYSTAVEAFTRYMKLIEPDASDFVKFADLQLMNHNVTASRELLDEAIALGEDSADSRLLEAKIARLSADYGAALERAKAAIELDPASGTAWSIIAELSDRASVDSALTNRLSGAITGTGMTPHDLELAQFALAELQAKSGDFEAAYGQIQCANNTKEKLLRDTGMTYSRESTEALLGIARRSFSGTRVPKVSSSQCSPIFIVGMPRSGTTVIHRLLDACGELQCLGESEALPFVYAQLQQRLGQIPEALAPELGEADWDQLASNYLQRAGAGDRDVVDKMPHNFLYVGMILSIFPRARIVQLRRNPFDVCMSILAKPFPEGHSYACNVRDLAHFYHHSQKLMDFWSQTFPQQVYDLDFDRFLEHPENFARSLFGFLGYAWDNDYLQARPVSSQAFTFSELQVRKPISKSGTSKWQPYREVASDLVQALEDESVNSSGGNQ